MVYLNLKSAIRPVPHGPDVPIPEKPTNLEDVTSNSESEVDEN